MRKYPKKSKLSRMFCRHDFDGFLAPPPPPFHMLANKRRIFVCKKCGYAENAIGVEIPQEFLDWSLKVIAKEKWEGE